MLSEATTPLQTPIEMENLSQWLTGAERGDLNPLLVTAQAVFRFLAIHPFALGNGHLSRLLATLLLLRAGYTYVAFVDFDSFMEADRSAYYQALRRTQRSLRSGQPEWEPWIEFFLGCLVRQKRELEKKIEAGETTLSDLSGLSSAIVNLLETRPAVALAGTLEATGASRSAVRAAFRRLVQRGVLAQKGKGRGTHYVPF